MTIWGGVMALNRSVLILLAVSGAVAVVLAATPMAQAQGDSVAGIGAAGIDPIAAPYVQALQGEGYARIAVDETWLGRVRIVAWLDGLRREIILHPTSGEVLRDLLEPPVTQSASAESGQTDGGGDGANTVRFGASVTRMGTTAAVGAAASDPKTVGSDDPAATAVGLEP